MKRATLITEAVPVAEAVAARLKRIRLNHNIDQFPLASHIIKQFLTSVNLLEVNITWPREMAEHIVNDVDWIVSMVTTMLYFGIAGYRVKYLPFYKAELVCSSVEFGGFVYRDSVFSWKSTSIDPTEDVVLPTYVAPGHRPYTYGREYSGDGWLYNGIISHHDFDFNTHNELTDDTLRASSRSSEGTFLRTVKFSQDLPLENVKRSIQQDRINPAYMVTESGEGFKEDAKALIAFTNTMVDASTDPPSDWKSSTVPSGVEQQRVAPPRSFIGGLIGMEEQILHRMSLLVFKAVPDCQTCIAQCIQDVYDAFLKPEIFYHQYLLIYQQLRDILVAAVTGNVTKEDKNHPIERAARAFLIYKNQIVRFAQLYNESSAQMVAFFSNLNITSFKEVIQDVQERYGGSSLGNIARNGAIRILLQWLRYEVQFCTDRINQVQAERHPPIKEKDKKKEKKIPDHEEREERLEREAAERKEKEAEIKAWEAAEQDKVTYRWKIATPDIATQDYGQPSITKEKRDQ